MRTCGTEWVDRKLRADRSAVGALARDPIPVVISQQFFRHASSRLTDSQVSVFHEFYGSVGRARTFVWAAAGPRPRRCNNRVLTALSCRRTFLASAVMATLAGPASSVRTIARKRPESVKDRRCVS